MTVTSLSVLEDLIREEHACANAAFASTLGHMIRCGELLQQARALVPKGQLNEWATTQVGLHPKTVRTYIRYYTHQQLLMEHGVSSGADARKLLARMELPRSNDAEHLAAAANRLREDGMAVQDIAEKLGVSAPRVSQWIHRDRHLERDRKKKADIASALRTAEIASRKRVVSKKGIDAVSETYVLIRRALDIMERERINGDGARAANVQSLLYRVEDALVEW